MYLEFEQCDNVSFVSVRNAMYLLWNKMHVVEQHAFVGYQIGLG